MNVFSKNEHQNVCFKNNKIIIFLISFKNKFVFFSITDLFVHSFLTLNDILPNNRIEKYNHFLIKDFQYMNFF